MFDLFQYTFIQRSFFVGTLIALIAPLMGQFLVVKRYSALADTLAHVSLVGVALGLLTKINPIFFATGVSVVASIFIEKLRKAGRLFGESVLVIFLSGSLGISTVILAIAGGLNSSLFTYLFGSINTISQTDILFVIAVFFIVCLILCFGYTKFFLISFDEDLAIAQGVKVWYWNMILLAASALIVSVGIQVVGALLIGSLMVLPVSIALQYRLGFKSTMVLATIFSVVSVWSGLVLAYYLDLASGGAIIIVNLVFFILSLVLNKI